MSSICNGASEFTVGNIRKGKKISRKVHVYVFRIFFCFSAVAKIDRNTFVSAKLADKKNKFLCYKYPEVTAKNPSNLKDS